MSKVFFNIFLLSFVTHLSVVKSFKFDFGTGTPANGYTKVTPDSKFNYAAGFGFNKGSNVTALRRKGERNIHCTSDGKWIIFRANFEGIENIYAVEIKDHKKSNE